MPIKPSYYNYFKFVLTDSRFSLVDRLEFLLFWLFLTGFGVMTLYSVWYLLFSLLSIFGLPLLAFTFAWYWRLHKKFGKPFAEFRGISGQQLKSQDQIALDFVSKNRNGKPALFLVIMVVTFFAALLFIPSLNLPRNFFYSILAGAVFCAVLIMIKIRKMWVETGDDQGQLPELMKKSAILWQIFIFILFVALSAFVVYRYKELTGQNPF